MLVGRYLFSEGKRKILVTRGTRLQVFVFCFCFFVNVNVILNFNIEMCIPLKRFQKKAHFIGGVSINWATGGRWQAKLLDTLQVTQINLPRQESVKNWYSGMHLARSLAYRISARTGRPDVHIL